MTTTQGNLPGDSASDTVKPRPKSALGARDLTSIARDYGMHFALAILVIAFFIVSPDFRTVPNLLNVLNQSAVIGIVSIGMTFVILTAGIDLSVGSLLALTSLTSGVFAVQSGASPGMAVLALLVPIGVGLIGGAINGGIISTGLASPLIVTLGTLTAYRGLAVQYHVDPIYGLPSWYKQIGAGTILGIPNPIIIFAVVILVASLVVNRSRFGRQVYAVGGNERAARSAGINVARIKLAVYVISGLCVAIAAVINTARVGAAQATAGAGLELQAVAAVVIGGTSLFGGRGKISNTVIGTLVLAVLFNGLVLLNVSSPIQSIIIGIIIIGAVSLDGFFRRRMA